MERKDIKQLCDESVEENLEHLSNIASYLYMNPEIAFQEHKACKVLCRELREHGTGKSRRFRYRLPCRI